MAVYQPEQYNQAFGAILGALIGDALGAVLEFLQAFPSEKDLENALQMPGGGVFKVAPGQFTDDGELTLSLARGLVASENYSPENIAKSYDAWVRSRPFDIGITTRRSLGTIVHQGRVKVPYATAMYRSAQEFCLASKANGSLMRSTPLGIYGFLLPDTELEFLVTQDSLLSHPNLSCIQAVTLYVIAIASLIQYPKDVSRALERVKNKAKLFSGEVPDWLQMAEKNEKYPYVPQEGFIKIAFVHAFRHLFLGTPFLEAVRETLAGGGDTDTNTCIVAGLLGARDGAESLPTAYKEKVLHCDYQKGIRRPDFLKAIDLPKLVQHLLEKAPTHLDIHAHENKIEV